LRNKLRFDVTIDKDINIVIENPTTKDLSITMNMIIPVNVDIKKALLDGYEVMYEIVKKRGGMLRFIFKSL